jgi:hypothetical protein
MKFLHEIMIQLLFLQLKYLCFGDLFNQSFDCVYIPEQLQVLEFGWNSQFRYSLQNVLKQAPNCEIRLGLGYSRIFI